MNSLKIKNLYTSIRNFEALKINLHIITSIVKKLTKLCFIHVKRGYKSIDIILNATKK